MNNNEYEITIVGSGPAGLSAALNAARSNKKILLLGPKNSQKLLKAPMIDNVLGIDSMDGSRLNKLFRSCVEKMENIEFSEDVVENIYAFDDKISLLMQDQSMIQTKALILAIGVSFGRPIEGEEEFIGRGVSSCAICDAALYKGKKVVIVAHSSHAKEEIEFIQNYASSVICVNSMGRPIELDDDIELIEDRAVSIQGSEKAESLNLGSGKKLEADGFFFIRDAKKADRLAPQLEMDGNHIKVDKSMNSSIKGVFACGDVVGRPYQISKAIGEGQIAALSAVNYINKLKKAN